MLINALTPSWSAIVSDNDQECRMASTICAVIQKKEDGTIEEDMNKYAREIIERSVFVENKFYEIRTLIEDAVWQVYVKGYVVDEKTLADELLSKSRELNTQLIIFMNILNEMLEEM